MFEADEWFESWLVGHATMARRDYMAAVSVFRDLDMKTILANNPSLLCQLAKGYYNAGEYSKAITIFQRYVHGGGGVTLTRLSKAFHFQGTQFGSALFGRYGHPGIAIGRRQDANQRARKLIDSTNEQQSRIASRLGVHGLPLQGHEEVSESVIFRSQSLRRRSSGVRGGHAVERRRAFGEQEMDGRSVAFP